MNTEPKPHLVQLTLEQAQPLLERRGEIGVPHVYGDGDRYAVQADEWRAFQAISGGEHG